MKRYVVANEAGEIVRTVVCTESQAESQAGDGETLIESGSATPSTHRVVNGELVPRSSEQIAERAERAARLRLMADRQAEIEAREAAQARPMREMLIALAEGRAMPAVAKAKLAAIESDVAALRAEIAAEASDASMAP